MQTNLTVENKLHDLINEYREWTNYGRVATYIPELSKARPNTLAIALKSTSGDMWQAGDYTYKFTMQSITKVFTLLLALSDYGEKIFEKVGMEPTGDPFNSIVKLETIKPNKPLNPFINAGAIVIDDMLKGNNLTEKIERILNFIRKLTGNRLIGVNNNLYLSELATGNRNRALAYFMKSYGILTGDVEETLKLYFMQSSIEVDVKDLAQMALVLANNGRDLQTGEELIPAKYAKIVKSFMVTCGMYNASGEFAMKVGIPAKSGVGGGILAVVPGKFGIGVVGPALDEKGNSIAGVKLLEELSEEFAFSIF